MRIQASSAASRGRWGRGTAAAAAQRGAAPRAHRQPAALLREGHRQPEAPLHVPRAAAAAAALAAGERVRRAAHAAEPQQQARLQRLQALQVRVGGGAGVCRRGNALPVRIP